MKTHLLFTCTLFLFGINLEAQQAQKSAYARFEENKGQWPATVKYMSKLNGGQLWVDQDGITFNFMSPEDFSKIEESRHGHSTIGEDDKLHQHA
ncbi:MAG TPA: hypothetical protein VK177_15895, partial [Flavobacteriales bacterium]|nr:hypothetical protein [Flavobacteriales bacterium]